MHNQHRICFLIPYFGKLPFWMPFFLASCKCNPSIDWIIFTDQSYQHYIPTNVKFVYKTFEEYNQLISNKLGIQFHPKNPYKLCDIKPALGYIHQDAIEEYDYWGFSDIDLIYGELRAYFTNDRLEAFELHSTHATRIAGHMCLIRNSSKMNKSFMRVKNWRVIFEDQAHHAFDEKAYSKLFLKHKNSPKWIQKIARIMNPWLRMADFTEAYSTPNARIPWVDGSIKYPTMWYWFNGKLTNNLTSERSFPYFHFLVWKKNMIHLVEAYSSYENISNFSISQNGFTLLND
jgi:hypothetical protein